MNTHALAFLQNINGPEILLIALVLLLFFGAKRLPDLFKSFGKSIKEFKKATSEVEGDIRSAMDTEEVPKPAPRAEAKQDEVEKPAVEKADEPKKDA
jgi:sec-independent protein translocase protein TatA